MRNSHYAEFENMWKICLSFPLANLSESAQFNPFSFNRNFRSIIQLKHLLFLCSPNLVLHASMNCTSVNFPRYSYYPGRFQSPPICHHTRICIYIHTLAHSHTIVCSEFPKGLRIQRFHPPTLSLEQGNSEGFVYP